MGKYMRKAKITADVAVMDVSQSSLGVRTRAKTLALQRLQATETPTPPAAEGRNPELSYLQLRSRRLEKPPFQQPTSCCKHNPDPKTDACQNPNPRTLSGSVGSASISYFSNKMEGFLGEILDKDEEQTEGNSEFGAEASFGENNLEFDARERTTRESTPCSLIRESNTLSTPGSSTRPTNLSAGNRGILNSVQRMMPTAQEIEVFFACAEQQQQRLFTEKYNFDVVSDLPLQGRYEWVRCNHKQDETLELSL